MKIIRTTGTNKNFVLLSKKLEEFQFSLLPELKTVNYNLTENMQDISGFVAYQNTTPIACIGFKKIDEQTCEIVRVFVLKEYRNKGIASALFLKILDLAKSLDYKRAEMFVWAQATEAVNLYKKLGFKNTSPKLSQIINANYIIFSKTL